MSRIRGGARAPPRTRTSYKGLHTHVTIQPLVKGRAAQLTQARHRTHAREHAAETAGAADRAGVVRRSAGRRWKVARWRADALSSPPVLRVRGRVRRLAAALLRATSRASPTASLLRPRGSPLEEARGLALPPARAAIASPTPVRRTARSPILRPTRAIEARTGLRIASIAARRAGYGLAVAARAGGGGRPRAPRRGYQ